MKNGGRFSANVMLLVTALLWGSSYALRKMALVHVGAFFFNAFRFVLGALISFAAYLVQRAFGKGDDPGSYGPALWQLKGGVLTGLAFGLGANLQQFGLMTSDAGKCAFITALYIFIIPLISRIALKRTIPAKIWFGASIATVGLFFVSLGTSFTIVTGDVMFFTSAFFFAVQVILVGHFVTRSNPLFIVSASLLTGSVLSLVLALVFEEGNSLDGLVAAMFPAVYTGVLSIGVANILQFMAQRNASPPVAAIIMSFESVFGALFAALILHERMSGQQIMGCCLIFSAIIISQVERRAKKGASP